MQNFISLQFNPFAVYLISTSKIIIIKQTHLQSLLKSLMEDAKVWATYATLLCDGCQSEVAIAAVAEAELIRREQATGKMLPPSWPLKVCNFIHTKP